MTTRYRVGDLLGAETAFRSGEEFFDAPAFVNRTGAIPQTFGNAALIAVLTGDSAAARQRANFALRAARLQNSAYDRCFAAYMVAMVEILLGADRKAAALGASALRLAEAIGFPQFAAIARIVIGRARAGMGDVDAGIAVLREGLAAMAGTYSRNAQTLYLTWLAEAALSGGDIDTALDTSDAALSVNADEVFYRPETLRIRSLALLRRGFVPEASALLREGEALAISMQAPWFTERMQPLKARLGLG
jgi:tetratricopeptide (TPR) repeat protein